MKQVVGGVKRWVVGGVALAALTHCGPERQEEPLPARSAPERIAVLEQEATASLRFPAVADTYADSTAPGQNFGSADQFRVDGSPQQHAYLRFNPSGVRGLVTHAKLRLYATGGTADGPQIHTTSNAFQENTLTWNNALRPNDAHVLQDTSDPDKYYFYEVYHDEEAFQAHTRTPHLARWRAAAAECLVGPSSAIRTNTVFPRDYA